MQRWWRERGLSHCVGADECALLGNVCTNTTLEFRLHSLELDAQGKLRYPYKERGQILTSEVIEFTGEANGSICLSILEGLPVSMYNRL